MARDHSQICFWFYYYLFEYCGEGQAFFPKSEYVWCILFICVFDWSRKCLICFVCCCCLAGRVRAGSARARGARAGARCSVCGWAGCLAGWLSRPLAAACWLAGLAQPLGPGPAGPGPAGPGPKLAGWLISWFSGVFLNIFEFFVFFWITNSKNSKRFELGA